MKVNLKKEFEKARNYNRCLAIQETCDYLTEQRKNDMDIMLQILSGKIIDDAKQIVDEEVANNIRDNYYMTIYK